MMQPSVTRPAGDIDLWEVNSFYINDIIKSPPFPHSPPPPGN